MFSCFQRGMFQEVLSLDPDGSTDPSDLGPWKDYHGTALLSLSKLLKLFRLVNWFYMKYSICTCTYTHLWAQMCSNIEGSGTEGSVNAKCLSVWPVHDYRYIYKYIYNCKTRVYFSRPNLSKLQCALLFAKAEARGVGSDTNKHSRREKQN